ncbi:M15 family metallopeptidase [Nonomuraea sp. MCN248]|uniref:M15 family metallopeptidase n=1 Tax=Nonomuraea corallina TaxID=2989783 RepID=A0ABT4SM75_9ACTN|nr:M15 family metallopeptidase [Nonomuraea corallina]MDA0638349.1 M15 family metallopeptidase [Nonomuraea corallina]
MKRAATLALVVLASVACGGRDPAASGEPAPPATSATTPATPTTTSAPPASPSPTATEPPEFTAKVSRLSRDQLRHSWREGCPVPYSDLRLITMTYWGFDDRPHTGELVVRENVTDDIITVFRKLYDWRWPIRRMELIDVYKGDDFDSIDADNTSAFNCRRATGSSGWSKHAYGQAIDINPRENPYVTASGRTAHANAEKYTKRPMKGKGVINPGDRVVRAFEQVGWEWGGYWSGIKDYQHFSKGGG